MKKFIFICLTLISLIVSGVQAQTPPHLTQGLISLNHRVSDLQMTIFWICAGISFLVFLIMLYAIIHHRKSQGVNGIHFHSYLFSELFWTMIPLLILLAMAIPATRVLFQMRQVDSADMTTQTKGNEWKWPTPT